MKVTAGLNGFGRFGLHLLKYWLDRRDECAFTIVAINDMVLALEDAISIIRYDPYVSFEGFHVAAEGQVLSIKPPDGRTVRIKYTQVQDRDIPWLGTTDLFFECSGRNPTARDCSPFIRGRTRQVLASSTMPTADQTLIYGWSHQEWDPASRIISYGSCTVNAFIPLAAWIHRRHVVLDCDVNVIHNRPRHRMKDTLQRGSCTLEHFAPAFLDFLLPQNFAVNYTVVPYSGASIIDFRFKLQHPPRIDGLFRELKRACSEGSLAGLYAVEESDLGPEPIIGTSFNAVLISETSKVRGHQLYLHAYFDNENSASRLFDLGNLIARRIPTTFCGYPGQATTISERE